MADWTLEKITFMLSRFPCSDSGLLPGAWACAYVVRKIQASIAEGEQKEKPILTPCSAKVAGGNLGPKRRRAEFAVVVRGGTRAAAAVFLLELITCWAMMERRRALTLPFTVENPLRIAVTGLPSDCPKLGQVSWTAFAGCKLRSRNSQHKNGSMMFHHSIANMEMSRKPLLILTDVLKTEPGKAYMERIKMRHQTCSQKEIGESKEDPLTPRDRRSSQRDTRTSRSVTPKSNQRLTPSSSQRAVLRRRQQNADEDDKEESQDIEEVIIGKDSDSEETFAEIVDCGLSLSWEPTEEAVVCDDFPPNGIEDRLADPGKGAQHRSKRKRKDSGLQCNGTGSPKRHRESVLHHRGSVLRLTVENEADGGATPTSYCQEESEDDVDLENLDNCIVQFTVGGDEETEALVPIITSSLEAGDIISSHRRSLLSGPDGASQTSSSEPIVLSSDEEESGDVSRRHSRVDQTSPTADMDTVLRRTSLQDIVCDMEDSPDEQDSELLQVVVGDGPCLLASSPVPDLDLSCMSVAFCSLHCGGFSARANGGLMIGKHQLIIPLKGVSEEKEMVLMLERLDLRRYSVWEQESMELRGLHFSDDELSPARSHGKDLATRRSPPSPNTMPGSRVGPSDANPGKASPIVVLTLRDPLVGMEGALLRSVLEIDCIKNLSLEQITATYEADRRSILVDNPPVLSLDNSIELIKSTGLDSRLLFMLGVTDTDPDPEPELSIDQASSHSDPDEIPTAHIWLEADLQKEPELEPETPETDEGTELESKEDQEEQELQDTTDSKKEEDKPVYTLCHHRTKGCYSVSMSKPDSRWIKYKHQGQARRLIQFPPPPLKGGITVTMEDLQCLDSGQYLNDVIIDFYLKYLLQNTSASVAERSHIFSSFFYKQLTRRDNASEGGNSDSCQRQRRHQRVKTWTRHVNIFKKDFLFVPVNQEAHWYLVVICFPGLDEPKLESRTAGSEAPNETKGCKSSDDHAETSQTLNRSDSTNTETENAQEDPTKDSPPSPVSCTEQTCQRKTVCKRPCILIMDSLKLSLHERVFKLLREYLQSEWEVRQGSSRDFGPDQMKSSHCKVPLQDNSSDCGLYLLQYVECFLKDPVIHFDLPLQLQQWFPRQQVRRKRDEIRDLILNLYRRQNLDNERDQQLCC
ncbi:uncharacterized protein FYW49_000436 [Xenentodon cancila]